MKVAVGAGFFAERNMDVNTGHRGKYKLISTHTFNSKE
jgi:hypothetical protein